VLAAAREDMVYGSWRLCWRSAESHVSAPSHWHSWQEIGTWLYCRKVKADTLLMVERRWAGDKL
jgi:hypothetical protein